MHRDVKPDNLLVSKQGVVKLTDFGIARKYEGSEKQYTSGVVTRYYKPPEILFGSKNYDKAIDMWGVGCVFAELMLGRPIFPGTTDFE